MVLVLASNSPRRRQILALGGWEFSVQAGEVDEQILPDEDAHQYVLRLAEWKALAVAGKVSTGTFVIAADTTVVDESQVEDQPAAILAKPINEENAIAMLRQLRGRTHRVLTGLVVLQVKNEGIALLSEVVTTEVAMRSYSDAEILDYVASGDPLDKAGAYAIQHTAFHPVERLKGCYANVVGLPLCALTRLLAEFGMPAHSDVARQCQAAAEGDPCAVAPLVMDGPPGSITGRGLSIGEKYLKQ